MNNLIVTLFLFFVQIIIFFKNDKLKNRYLNRYYLIFIIYIISFPIINLIFFNYLRKISFFNSFFINSRHYIIFQLFIFLFSIFVIIKTELLNKIFTKINSFLILKGIELFIITSIFNYIIVFLIKYNMNSSNFIKNILIYEKNIYFKILFFMILGVFIPILEEIVFRYLLIEGLLKKNSNISIIIYSSLIFALIHLQINNLLIYFIYSAFYAAYYLKYRSIYPTLICHVLNNITVLFSFIIFK